MNIANALQTSFSWKISDNDPRRFDVRLLLGYIVNFNLTEYE